MRNASQRRFWYNLLHQFDIGCAVGHNWHGGDTDMANVQKYNRGQIGGLTRHYERDQKEDGTYYAFGNQEIDTSRIHLNYNLAPEHDGGQLSFISKRTSEVKCHNRADVNVMCSWVITAPKDLESGEHELFFREAYVFLNQRYANGSDKNVISAYVHMDETQPHLHYAFVPVVHDKKKGSDKVSAKIAVDRFDLQSFHQDLERYMANIFGREIGILNEATKDGNQSIDELKRGTAQTEKEQLMANVSELRNLELEHQRGIKVLEREKKRLQGQIRAVEGKLKTQQGIENIPITISRPTFGNSDGEKDKVTMLKSDYDSLVNTALASPRIKTAGELKETKEEVSHLGNRVKALVRENKVLQAEVSNLKKQIPKKPSFEESKAEAIISAFRRIPEKDQMDLINAYNANGRARTVNRSDPSL